MTFRFRQFGVEDQRSTMRVGTDAILLGAWADVTGANTILDIGTGCGVIALMLAQRSGGSIDAIEADPASAEEARENFRASRWNGRLRSFHGPVQDHAGGPYDLIVSNPPFFRNSMKPPAPGRRSARHNENLDTEQLIGQADRLAGPGGRLCLVLPYNDRALVCGTAMRRLFFLRRSLAVIPKPGKEPVRVLLEFGRTLPEKTVEEVLVLKDENGNMTPEYLELTGAYHQFSI